MRYVIDIDDTILYSDYANKEYVLRRHNQKVLDIINDLYNNHVIILYTGRHWDHLEITLKQLNSIGVKFHTLVMGKPTGDYFIDDKSLRPEEFIELYRPQ